MKAIFSSIVTLALGIAIGFVVGKVREGGPVEMGNRSPAPQEKKDGRSGSEILLADLLKGRSPGDLAAEEAYRFFLPWLSANTRRDSFTGTLEELRVNNQLRLLMEKLPMPILEEVLDLARQGKFPLESSHDLFAAFAARDWEKAMVWAAGQPDTLKLRSAAISRIATSDPGRAEEFYQQALLDGMDPDSDGIIQKLAMHHIQRGPAEFFAFMETLPMAMTGNLYQQALEKLPADKVAAFLEEFRRYEEKSNPGVGMLQFLGSIAGSHPEEFRKHAENLRPSDKMELFSNLAATEAESGNIAQAREFLKTAISIDPSRAKDHVANKLGLFSKYPELVVAVRDLLPKGQEISAEDLTIWRLLPGPGPGENLAYGRFLKSPAERAEHAVNYFDGISKGDGLTARDFKGLSITLRTLGLPGEEAKKAEAALENARKRVMEKE